MSEEPRYHDAPYTLDSNREILPEDVEQPLPSAGHTEEMAERVKVADVEFTEGVEAEREYVDEHGEVGPQDPAAPDDESEESQAKRERDQEQGDQPSQKSRRKKES
jgi:hypothetical protein